MEYAIIVFVLMAALFVGTVVYAAIKRDRLSKAGLKRALAVNICCFALIALFAVALPFMSPARAEAQTTGATEQTQVQAPYKESGNTSPDSTAAGFAYIAAALTTGAACIGAGIAVASGASAAIGATGEDPKIFGKALIFVTLGEGIAIYGLLISFMILSKIG